VLWGLRDHEVSSLMTNGAGDALWLGWCFGLGLPPRAKTSTTLMHPPQQGHGRSSLKGSSAGAATALLVWKMKIIQRLRSSAPCRYAGARMTLAQIILSSPSIQFRCCETAAPQSQGAAKSP